MKLVYVSSDHGEDPRIWMTNRKAHLYEQNSLIRAPYYLRPIVGEYDLLYSSLCLCKVSGAGCLS